jgi:hypothetical protein
MAANTTQPQKPVRYLDDPMPQTPLAGDADENTIRSKRDAIHSLLLEACHATDIYPEIDEMLHGLTGTKDTKNFRAEDPRTYFNLEDNRTPEHALKTKLFAAFDLLWEASDLIPYIFTRNFEQYEQDKASGILK